MDTISPRMLGLSDGGVALFTGHGGGPGTRAAIPPLRKLWRLAIRRRWVLIGGVVAGAILGLLLTLLATPQYTSSVRLEISRETARVVNIDSVERDASIGDQEFYQTQYGLLQTRELAERVARDVGAVDDDGFFAMFGRDDLIGAVREKRVEAAGRILLDHVNVAPVRGSRLVDVSVVTPDPALSQRIAGTWARDFIASNIERRFEASSYARTFLESRLEQLRQRLEQSERQAVAYAARQGIVTLPSPSNEDENGSAGGRSLLTDDLGSLNAALATATAERIAAQSRLVAARRPDASSEALGNDTIAALRQQRAKAAADYADMMIQFEPSYPPAKALTSQIATLDAAIGREEARIRTALEQDFRAAATRERALSARVAGLKGDLIDLRRRSIQYNIYQRDADTNRELYNALLQRYKEIGVAGAVENNNIAVVDAPKLPDHPSSPNLIINLILGMLAGGLAGAGVAAALEQIDEGIADPGEVEEKLGLPLLGTVPRVTGEDPLAALDEPRSPLFESYLAVQTNLELSTAHGTPRSFAVTSTRPREGKSTSTIALAQSLARAHRRVVLIDADLRSPSIHSAFDIDNAAGVSNLLAGSDDVDAVLHATTRERLSVIPAGPQPPNAAELLTGDRLRALVEQLHERFDHVILDCPPVIGLADAPLVASAVESVIYAVEARSIQAGTVRMAIDRLRTAHANILGVMLTKFEAKRGRLGYGYDDYGYGYGG